MGLLCCMLSGGGGRWEVGRKVSKHLVKGKIFIKKNLEKMYDFFSKIFYQP